MNHPLNTGVERTNVLENLRNSGTFFPDHWDPLRTHQQESKLSNLGFDVESKLTSIVITSLL